MNISKLNFSDKRHSRWHRIPRPPRPSSSPTSYITMSGGIVTCPNYEQKFNPSTKHSTSSIFQRSITLHLVSVGIKPAQRSHGFHSREVWSLFAMLVMIGLVGDKHTVDTSPNSPLRQINQSILSIQNRCNEDLIHKPIAVSTHVFFINCIC